MPIANHYQTLGVKLDAKPEEIRRVYRQLAVKLHPDRNPGDKTAEAKFKVVSEAYDILSDQDKRSKYDREVREASKPPPPPPNYPVADISVELELEAHEILYGCEKTVTVSRPRTCPDCRGTGHVSGRYMGPCQLCGGTGCQPCGWTGTLSCARCWGSGADRDLTTISIHVPAQVAPHGRQKFVGNGNLWGLRGPFYVYANVGFKVKKPGLIVW